MTKWGYNHIPGIIQEMSGFFVTWAENLKAPAPAMKNHSEKKWKKRKTPSSKQKAVIFKDPNKDSSEDGKP